MDPLAEIFQKTSKPGKDGKRYIFFKTEVDVTFLYFSGFVDAKKYSCDDWIKAFKSSQLSDGSYAISEQRWLEKKKFHYNGPVDLPWDPMTIKDGEYPEKEIRKLLAEKVIPCTVFNESMVQVYMNNLKAQGRLVNGKGFINKAAKEYILQIINQYPSPLRVLQISVNGLRRARRGFTQAAQDQIQKSGFASGMTAQQIYANRLADLSKKQTPKETPPPPAATDKPTVSVKDLQKKRRTPGKV